MAFGEGFSNFNFLKPETDEEFKLVLSMGNEAARKHGKKPSAQIKQQVQAEINQALEQSRSGAGGGVAGNLSQTLGQHDFSQDLMVDPVAPDPSITGRIGTAENIYGIQSRRALEKSNEPFGLDDVSTFDKIATGAGLAAAVAGAFGAGGRGARGPLGAVSKFGLGRGLSAENRFRQQQQRTLQGELGEAQATRQASLGIPRAQLQQQELETDYSEDLFGRGAKRAGFDLESDRLGLRGQELERGLAQDERGFKPPSFEEQIKNQAIQMVLNGMDPEALPQPYYDAYHSGVGAGVQRGRDIREITQEFENKQAGFQTGFQDLAQARYPDAYEGWLKSSVEPSLSDIGRNAKLGRGGFGPTTESNWFSADKYGVDPELKQAADSMLFYRDQGNLPGYIDQHRGTGQQAPQYTKAQLNLALSTKAITKAEYDKAIRNAQ